MNIYYKEMFNKKSGYTITFYYEDNSVIVTLLCQKGDNILLLLEDYLTYNELDISFSQLIPKG